MSGSSDWGFESELSEYDPNEHVKVRMLSDIEIPISKRHLDRQLEESKSSFHQEIIHVDAVILDLHGGGFMFGSSNKQVKYSSYFTKHTGYPNFSVDYRLAPEYKFPCSLNDVWLTYLWLITSSEENIGLRFDKIIVSGHSAGANLALGIVTL